MKRKAYLKMCMLLLLLSLISGHLSSQELKTMVIDSADSVSRSLGSPDAVPIVLPVDSLEQPIETRACANTFTNQIVAAYEVVTGCVTLTVQSVTVTSTGDLYLIAPDEIIIDSDFEVALGGQLHIGITPPQLPNSFDYTYDASGNRIARTLAP